MCLEVIKSHVRKPIHEMECYKELTYVGEGTWETPYRSIVVPAGNGWFAPLKPAKRQVREYRIDEIIEGGYIHAFTKNLYSEKLWVTIPKTASIGDSRYFKAYARDVVAEGDWNGDIVCRALYIPAFDLTGAHRNAILDLSGN